MEFIVRPTVNPTMIAIFITLGVFMLLGLYMVVDPVAVVRMFDFRVIQSWKGEPAKEYTILAGAPPEKPLPPGMIIADCDVHFEKGGEYLVFTTDGYAEANACAPTGTLQKSADMVRALDQLRTKARNNTPPN